MTPERELRELIAKWRTGWIGCYFCDELKQPCSHHIILDHCADELEKLLAAIPVLTGAPDCCLACGGTGKAAPAPTPSWLPSAKRLEGRFNELLEAMYEELKPGPTGGNDYHDAWQVFGEQLTVAHEVISALKELPAPTPAPPTELEALAAQSDSAIDTSDIPEVKDWSKAERGKFYRGPAEAVVPEREPHRGWSLAKEIAADLEDAGLVESGLAGIKAMEIIERRLAAEPQVEQK